MCRDFRAKRHLDTRAVLHGSIEDRFCNRDVLAGPLGEFRDERVEILGSVVGKRGLHGFVTGMEGKERGMHAIARDILDIFVVHDRVDETVSKEILVHVVVQFLLCHGIELEAVIRENVVGGGTEFLPGFLP